MYLKINTFEYFIIILITLFIQFILQLPRLILYIKAEINFIRISD